MTPRLQNGWNTQEGNMDHDMIPTRRRIFHAYAIKRHKMTRGISVRFDAPQDDINNMRFFDFTKLSNQYTESSQQNEKNGNYEMCCHASEQFSIQTMIRMNIMFGGWKYVRRLLRR